MNKVYINLVQSYYQAQCRDLMSICKLKHKHIMKKLFILYHTPILSFSQQSEIDTVLLSKMIIANVNTDFPVGKKINTDCTLGDTQIYRSAHSEAPKLAQVTDYILCNNGGPNMFFEIR